MVRGRKKTSVKKEKLKKSKKNSDPRKTVAQPKKQKSTQKWNPLTKERILANHKCGFLKNARLRVPPELLDAIRAHDTTEENATTLAVLCKSKNIDKNALKKCISILAVYTPKKRVWELPRNKFNSVLLLLSVMLDHLQNEKNFNLRSDDGFCRWEGLRLVFAFNHLEYNINSIDANNIHVLEYASFLKKIASGRPILPVPSIPTFLLNKIKYVTPLLKKKDNLQLWCPSQTIPWAPMKLLNLHDGKATLENMDVGRTNDLWGTVSLPTNSVIIFKTTIDLAAVPREREKAFQDKYPNLSQNLTGANDANPPQEFENMELCDQDDQDDQTAQTMDWEGAVFKCSNIVIINEKNEILIEETIDFSGTPDEVLSKQEFIWNVQRKNSTISDAIEDIESGNKYIIKFRTTDNGDYLHFGTMRLSMENLPPVITLQFVDNPLKKYMTLEKSNTQPTLKEPSPPHLNFSFTTPTPPNQEAYSASQDENTQPADTNVPEPKKAAQDSTNNESDCFPSDFSFKSLSKHQGLLKTNSNGASSLAVYNDTIPINNCSTIGTLIIMIKTLKFRMDEFNIPATKASGKNDLFKLNAIMNANTARRIIYQFKDITLSQLEQWAQAHQKKFKKQIKDRTKFILNIQRWLTTQSEL